MRSRWGLASFLCVVLVAPAAMAQSGGDLTATTAEEPNPAPQQEIGYGAMPGGLHVPSAEMLAKGTIQLSTLEGFGFRKGLLDPNHKYNRAIADLAVAYAATDTLSIGLSLDGRYDRHSGIAPSGDDGYVGDPHLLVRFGKAFGTMNAGGQLGVWVPGKNAPSIAGSAISVDVRGIVTLAAGPGKLSIDAGFRLDNSAQSVDTRGSMYSLQDRVSLGVSEYNALFGGLHLMVPTGKLWIGAEASLDAFIGGAPTGAATLNRGSLTFRGDASVGYHLNDDWALLFFVEMAKVPGIQLAQVMNNNIPLVPYEPVFTGGLGLEARFGGPKKVDSGITERDCHKHNPPDCPNVKVPIVADITGTVVDAGDKPVIGAKVSLTLKNSQVAPVATDDKGTYVFKGVPIGNSIDNKPTIEETGVEVAVEVSNMKPGKSTLTTVTIGSNTVPPIKLEPLLPPGQLRGVVRALPAGKAVQGAIITVAPGDQKVESGADGTFTLDLPPGVYKITVKAKDLASQELDVTIEPNGVAIKNIDLHK
jgi:hypothetical protein